MYVIQDRYIYMQNVIAANVFLDILRPTINGFFTKMSDGKS